MVKELSCSYVSWSILERDHDLELICDNGVVFSYQSLLASLSRFLNSMFSMFHWVEFSVGDWHHGEMFLLDRRKSSDTISISLPGVDKSDVKIFLDLIHTGIPRYLQ